jgi:hypothetical protein
VHAGWEGYELRAHSPDLPILSIALCQAWKVAPRLKNACRGCAENGSDDQRNETGLPATLPKLSKPFNHEVHRHEDADCTKRNQIEGAAVWVVSLIRATPAKPSTWSVANRLTEMP